MMHKRVISIQFGDIVVLHDVQYECENNSTARWRHTVQTGPSMIFLQCQQKNVHLLSQYTLTMANTEIIYYLKNVGAKVAMNFT